MCKKPLLLALSLSLLFVGQADAKIGFRQYNTPFGGQAATNWITPNAANHLITSTDGEQWISASTASIISGGLDADLTAFAALDGTAGYLVKTGANAYARRTFQHDGTITITNPAGTAGNSTISVNVITESQVTNLVADLAGKAALVHGHDESDITGLVADLAGKAALLHTHAESDVTNLVSDLAGKAPLVHTHVESDVTNLVSDLAAKQPLDSTLTAFAALDGTAGFVVITATDTIVRRSFAVGSAKLTVANPAGTAGDVTYDLGTVAESDITNLVSDLAGKAATVHTHAESDVTNLVSDLAAKQPLDADLTTLAGLSGALQSVRRNAANNDYELYTPTVYGSGTVTSIGVNAPSTMFTSSADITTAGDVTLSYATGQTASRIFGTNSSGDVGLMAMTTAQLVSHTHAQADVTSLVADLAAKQPLDTQLTTISTLGSALQQIRVNAGATDVEYFTPSGGSGTVTSVGVNGPSTIFSSSADITTAGDVTLSYATGQTASRIYGTSAAGTAGLMAMTAAQLVAHTHLAADIPATVAYTNAANSFSTAQLPSAQGTIDLGSDLFTFKSLWLGGSTTFSHNLVATTPTVDRVHTLPNANSNTIRPLASQTANQWVAYIDATGLQNTVQPAFSNISGTATAAQLPTTTSFFGGDGSRTLPTSGALSGIYMHSGNWTSTGTTTVASGTRIFGSGTFTLSHAMTVSPVPMTYGDRGDATRQNGSQGGGLGGGLGGSVGTTRAGGQGGGGFNRGGAGGLNGNTAYSGGGAGRGFDGSAPADGFNVGSGGGGGNHNVADNQVGGLGGNGGGTVYIEILGNVQISAAITANGGVGNDGAGTTLRGGAGGGGGGGAVEIRTRGTYTQNAAIAINANGSVGGAGGSTRGGGGGGGGGGWVQVLAASTYTNSGSFTTTGGTGGASGSGESVASTNGGSGTSSGTGSLTSVPSRF